MYVCLYDQNLWHQHNFHLNNFKAGYQHPVIYDQNHLN